MSKTAEEPGSSVTFLKNKTPCYGMEHIFSLLSHCELHCMLLVVEDICTRDRGVYCPLVLVAATGLSTGFYPLDTVPGKHN